jgi:hypothetical protein
MNSRRALCAMVSAGAAAAALWSYLSQSRPAPAARVLVPIEEGKTIDFSGGIPSVRDTAADRAAIDAAVREMDAAAKDVSFPADTPPKK